METDLLFHRFVAFVRRTGIGGLVVLAAATATAVFLAGTIVSPSLRQRSVDVATGVSERLQEVVPGFDRGQGERDDDKVTTAAPSGSGASETGSAVSVTDVNASSSGAPDRVLAVAAQTRGGSKAPEGVQLDTDAARPGGGGGQTGGGGGGTTDPVDVEVPSDGGGDTDEGETPQPEDPDDGDDDDGGSDVEEPAEDKEKPSKAPKPSKPSKPAKPSDDEEEPAEPEEPKESDDGEEDDDQPEQVTAPKEKAPKPVKVKPEKEESEPGDD